MFPFLLIPLGLLAFYFALPRRRVVTTTTAPTQPLQPQQPIESKPVYVSPPSPPYVPPIAQPTQQRPTNISQNGLSFIAGQEGFSANAYRDPPGSNTWSIGYGHKIVSGDGLSSSSVVSQAQAQSLLSRDVSIATGGVLNSVRVPINQGQLDALISLAYNIGVSAFAASTLLRKLNAQDYSGAAQEFGRWIYAGGRIIPALQQRRAAEMSMFNGALV